MKYATWKRFLSMLSVLALAAGLIPTIAMPVSAAYAEGDIAGTTGGGTSALDAVVCDTFEELKQALQNSDIEYVKLKTGNFAKETLPATDSQTKGKPAMEANGTKYLTLDGHKYFVSSAEKDYDALIQVNGRLTIDGSGSLTYEHNSNNGVGAVISMNQALTELKIKGDGVTLNGEVDTALAYGSSAWAFARAIVASNGSLDIEGGNFTGRVYDAPGAQNRMHRSAVYVGNEASATIRGGVYRMVRSFTNGTTIHSHPCGATFAPSDPAHVDLRGGTFYGMYITGYEKRLDAYLADGYFFYDEKEYDRYAGDTKESPATSKVGSDGTPYYDYHPVAVESFEGVTEIVAQNPTPSEGTETDLGTVYLGTPSIQQLFYFSAKALPTRVRNGGYTLRLGTDVYRDGTLVKQTTDGNTVNLKEVATQTGNYTVVQRAELFDSVRSETVETDSHRYSVKVENAPIETVTAGLVFPKVGEYPVDITINNDNVKNNGTIWYISEDGLTPISDSTPIKNGKKYYITVSIAPQDGYVFSEALKATVNGMTANVTVSSPQSAGIGFWYETEPAALTEIRITTPPSETVFLEGDAVRFDGMVVTAYFADGTERELAWGEYELPQALVAKDGMTSFEVSYNFRGIVKTATQTIRVTPADYALAFNLNGTVDFGTKTVNYGAGPSRYVTLENIGNQKTGVVKFTLSGENADCFVLGSTQTMLQPGWTKDIKINPVSNLEAGVYKATLTAADEHSSVAIDLTFRVIDGVAVSGTVFAEDEDSRNVTVQLYEEGSTEPAYETIVSGATETAYRLEGVLPATYTVRILRAGYATVQATIVVDLDDVSLDIELERLLDVGEVNATVDGFALFKPFGDVQMSIDNPYVTVEQVQVLTMGASVPATAGVEPDTNYLLVAKLSPAEGYALDRLTEERCFLEGVPAMAVNYDEEFGTAYAIFLLPAIPLTPVEYVEFAVEGYELGAAVADLSVTDETDGVGVVQVTVYGENGAELTEDTFEEGRCYRVLLAVALEAGYEEAWAPQDLIMRGATLFNMEKDAESGLYMIVFDLDPLMDAKELLLGDVDLNGDVNTLDVVALFEGVSGATVLSGVQESVADVNGDGEINTIDVTDLFAIVSGQS